MNNFNLLVMGDINIFKGIETKIQMLNDKIDHITYWANPWHWVQELWKEIHLIYSNGTADLFLMIGTIAAIWLIMLGAEKPKKYLFWTWIGFWFLRAVIFA